MAATITPRILWTHYRGTENAMRHYADALASWMLQGYADHDAPITGLSPAQSDRIVSPYPNSCVPPWCWEYPRQVAANMIELAQRLQAMAEATQLLAEQIEVPPDTRVYVSEMPGTGWGNHKEP